MSTTAMIGLLLPVPSPGADDFEPIEFVTITSDAFIGNGPGPDGLVGTADDVEDDRNTAGTVSYGIPQTWDLLYSEATTTIDEPYVFENGRSAVTHFSTSGSLGPDASFSDYKELPPFPFPFSFPPVSHEMVTDLRGGTDGDFAVLLNSDAFSQPERAGFVNQSARGKGFFLVRGADPYELPGIDPALASYLDYLTGVAPENWTAITIKAGGRLDCADWDPVDEGFAIEHLAEAGIDPALTRAATEEVYERLDPLPGIADPDWSYGRPIKVYRGGTTDPASGGGRFEHQYIYLNVSFAEDLSVKREFDDGRVYQAASINRGTSRKKWRLAEPYPLPEDTIVHLPDGTPVVMPGGSIIPVGTPVGLQERVFRLSDTAADSVCVFRPPGSICTFHGESEGSCDGNEPGHFLPYPSYRSLTGGVVATASTSIIEFDVVPTPVAIDIRPNTDPNRINPFSRGIVPVAILSSSSFDVADVDIATLIFGPDSARPVQRNGLRLEGDDGDTEGSTLRRVDFFGETFDFPNPSDGTVSGTFGVYDVPPGTTLVPVDASKIEFAAAGMRNFNGAFTGWRNVSLILSDVPVVSTMYLDFTHEPPDLTALSELGYIDPRAFLEDDQLLWHLHSTSTVGPGGGTPIPYEWFHNHVAPFGFFGSDEGSLTLTSTVVPDPGILVARFRSDEAGIVLGQASACVRGKLLDGTPFKGCDNVLTVPACGIGFELACLLPPVIWLRRRRRLAPGRARQAV